MTNEEIMDRLAESGWAWSIDTPELHSRAQEQIAFDLKIALGQLGSWAELYGSTVEALAISAEARNVNATVLLHQRRLYLVGGMVF